MASELNVALRSPPACGARGMVAGPSARPQHFTDRIGRQTAFNEAINADFDEAAHTVVGGGCAELSKEREPLDEAQP